MMRCRKASSTSKIESLSKQDIARATNDSSHISKFSAHKRRNIFYNIRNISKKQLLALLFTVASVICLFDLHSFDFYYDFPDLTSMLPAESMRTIMDKMNALEWSKRMREDFFASFDFRPSMLHSGENDRPGYRLAKEYNLKAYSPVIMLPGFTSTGLEVWKGRECSQSYFRQRMWGTARMLQQFMMNQRCWLEHVMLNRSNGLDPEGIKLRPATGLEAADYVIGGFWVWGKIIENLADIGYDTNSMFMAPFDWRLAPFLMQERDQYLTKLRYMIEMAKVSNDNRKVVVISHSYASQVWFYFMKWVESEAGGKQGTDWVSEHIDSFINIAGPMLGTVKPASALLSGEMKDTAELGSLSKILGYFFGSPARALLARSWPSVYAMLPLGGSYIWGNHTYAPDDIISRLASPATLESDDDDELNAESEAGITGLNAKFKQSIEDHIAKHGSCGTIVRFSPETRAENWTADTVRDGLEAIDGHLGYFKSSVSSVDVAIDPTDPKYDDSRYWINPLASKLPNAPDMKIFCLYGVGKPVERAYSYKRAPIGADESIQDTTNRSSAEEESTRIVPFVLDTEYMDLPWIKSGIRYVDGDGTVPLISLGYMCARGWQHNSDGSRNPLNPSAIDVRTREFVHNPVSLIYDSRGGPETSDHVDIMGNHALIRDVLYISARQYHHVPTRIISEIHKVADRVILPQEQD